MCLVAIAWRAHPHYPLVVAGNRDEFHARPSGPADWWADAPAVLGGRDLVAGGSWLGVTRSGRVAVVVNQPERPPAPEHDLSRGHLVRDFLLGEAAPGGFLDDISDRAHRYAGFCVVVGAPDGLAGLVSPAGPVYGRWELPAGISALSNGPLESPAPKAAFLADRIAALLATGDPTPRALLEPLLRREPVEPFHPRPFALTPFVLGPRYGTRASTVVMLDRDGNGQFLERRWGADGSVAGESRFDFAAAPAR